MKKLSIKEKAKRYDEAITDGTPVEDAIFPELKESEDEKVRKTLIDYFKNYKTQEDIGIKTFFGIPTDDIIAWLEKVGKIVDYYEDKLDKCACDYFNKGYKKALEKQGEQEETLCDKCRKEQPSHSCQDITALGRCALEKQGEKNPADKVEPKFKDGDYIVYRDYVWKVFNISLEKYYELLKINNEISTRSIEDVDNNAHLWTIQDAKDGDVLHSTGWHNDCIFIFNSLDNWKFDEPDGDREVATGYCCLFVSADKIEFDIQGPDCVEVNTIKPATKEQRDLLFQKMKEAGYEWDADKKELKMIEQKTAEQNVDNRKLFDIVIEELSKYSGNEVYKAPWALDSTGVQYPLYFAELGVKWQKEQNPAWSEEDERMIDNIIFVLEENQENISGVGYKIEWLKSLKCRVQPQQEWNGTEIAPPIDSDVCG